LNESVIDGNLKPATGDRGDDPQHSLRGTPTGGSIKRAPASKLDEALDGLERICG